MTIMRCSAYSALEVLHIMRYINLLTYLLTYLNFGGESQNFQKLGAGMRVTCKRAKINN